MIANQDKPSDKTSFCSPLPLLVTSSFIALAAGALIPLLKGMDYDDDSLFHHLDQEVFLIVNLALLATAFIATAWNYKALKNLIDEDNAGLEQPSGSATTMSDDLVKKAYRVFSHLKLSLGFVAAGSFCLVGAFVWAVSTPDVASFEEAPGKTFGLLYTVLGLSAAVGGLTATVAAYDFSKVKSP